MRPIHLVSLFFLLVFGLSACKPESSENKAAPAAEKAAVKAEPVQEKKEGLFGGIFSSEPEPVKLDLGEFKLLEVNLGTSLDADTLVTKPKTLFGTKDKIYASVLSNGKHQGLSIKARWTAPDGSLVAETEQALVPVKGTVSTFSISNDQPWPVGTYTLDISLNGLVQRTVSFEVK
ncbi:MAG: hypothetical protein ABI644_04155 [Arenimonas sp.]